MTAEKFPKNQYFQNFTQDNRTQGIMEKSQWDLKRIRFQRRRLTRLDDFVQTYQKTHDALIIEYQDRERTRKKVRSIFCFVIVPDHTFHFIH